MEFARDLGQAAVDLGDGILMRMEDRGDLLVGTLDDDTLECTYLIVSDTGTDELREEVAGISDTEA